MVLSAFINRFHTRTLTTKISLKFITFIIWHQPKNLYFRNWPNFTLKWYFGLKLQKIVNARRLRVTQATERCLNTNGLAVSTIGTTGVIQVHGWQEKKCTDEEDSDHSFHHAEVGHDAVPEDFKWVFVCSGSSGIFRGFSENSFFVFQKWCTVIFNWILIQNFRENSLFGFKDLSILWIHLYMVFDFHFLFQVYFDFLLNHILCFVYRFDLICIVFLSFKNTFKLIQNRKTLCNTQILQWIKFFDSFLS